MRVSVGIALGLARRRRRAGRAAAFVVAPTLAQQGGELFHLLRADDAANLLVGTRAGGGGRAAALALVFAQFGNLFARRRAESFNLFVGELKLCLQVCGERLFGEEGIEDGQRHRRFARIETGRSDRRRRGDGRRARCARVRVRRVRRLVNASGDAQSNRQNSDRARVSPKSQHACCSSFGCCVVVKTIAHPPARHAASETARSERGKRFE